MTERLVRVKLRIGPRDVEKREAAREVSMPWVRPLASPADRLQTVSTRGADVEAREAWLCQCRRTGRWAVAFENERACPEFARITGPHPVEKARGIKDRLRRGRRPEDLQIALKFFPAAHRGAPNPGLSCVCRPSYDEA